jgi:hypothetical protein
MLRPSLFEAAHLDVWPIVILVVTVAFFLVFTSSEQRRAQMDMDRRVAGTRP